MFRLFRWKKGVHRDVAAKLFITHCASEGRRLEADLTSLLADYCDGQEGRPDLEAVLARPLLSYREGHIRPNPRPLFGAHCYAIALSRGLLALYETREVGSQDRVMDWQVSKLVAEEEVGVDRAGHAPNPRPEPGVHISYRPDVFVGGVDSQQLTLVKRYRKLKAARDELAMLCLALRVVPVDEGVAVRVLEEIPGSRIGDLADYDLVGYRAPDEDELDEWSENLVIVDADRVLAPLASSLRETMLHTLAGLDPFWPSFCESNRLTW